MISTIVWNCRGMGARTTRLHLKEMIRYHKPAILALLETKVHSSHVLGFLAHLGFTELLAVEAMGYVGGISVLWNDSITSVEVVSMEDQCITVLVKDGLSSHWVLTVVYASPHFPTREFLWQYLEAVGTIIKLLWVILGDVNQPLHESDKRGGRPVRPARTASLHHMIESCHLVDLGYHGPRFTWTNGRHGRANIQERIDRAWGNVA